MEEMATWDMIFNKTHYGKTGNEHPSKNEITSIRELQVTSNHANNELVNLNYIETAKPQTGNYTFHVVNSV
jgi:hypothetical protein